METTIERVLDVELTEPELVQRGRELSEVYSTYERFEAQKKEQATSIKELLDGARDEMKRISRIIARRAEPRAVKCRWVEDYQQNVRTLVRLDTGEVLETKPLTAAERQGSLLS